MNSGGNYLDSRLDNLRGASTVIRNQNNPVAYTNSQNPGVSQTYSSSTPTLGKPNYGLQSYQTNLAPPTIIASNTSFTTPTFQGHVSSTNPMSSIINPMASQNLNGNIRNPVYVEPVGNVSAYKPHTSVPTINMGISHNPNTSYNNIPNTSYNNIPNTSYNNNISNIPRTSNANFEPKFTGGYNTDTLGFNTVTNNDLNNIQSRIHREIDDKVKLELEKKELELMLDQEYKRQEDITNYYDQEKRVLRDETWNLEQQSNNLERNLDSKTSQAKDIEAKINNASNENKNLVQENNNLKDELRKLGEMTNIRVRELDDKLSQNINIVENEKTQYRRDLEGKKIQNAEKVKRMEDEYNRRLGEWQIKLQRANETAFKYESEINLLKEKMHALNAEARSKVEQVKQRVQEEESRKSSSILRALENK